MPRTAAVALLQQAKKEKDLAIEDFRDAFGVTHEAAALRFTNLATEPPRHAPALPAGRRRRRPAQGLRERRAVRCRPTCTGAIEGQVVCRKWSARTAFDAHRTARPSTTSTPTPRRARSGARRRPGRTASRRSSRSRSACRSRGEVVPRARDHDRGAGRRCPDEACCRRAPTRRSPALVRARRLAERRACTRTCSRPLPTGTFPGVDDAEVYAFLEAPRRPVAASATRPLVLTRGRPARSRCARCVDPMRAGRGRAATAARMPRHFDVCLAIVCDTQYRVTHEPR